jgi:hypothetical protein
MSGHVDNSGGGGGQLVRHARVSGNAAAPVLDRLRANAQLRRGAAELERELVASARREGATWQQIADALGMSRQSAQQRFGRRGIAR